MRGKRPWTLGLAQSWFVASVLVSCNSILGLDQFTVGTDASQVSAQGGSAGQKSDGTGGTDPNRDAGDARAPECTTNAECTEKATLEAANADPVPPVCVRDPSDGHCVTAPAVCLQPEGRCVTLLSEDCTLITPTKPTDSYLNDHAVLIGSLYQTTNSTVSQNLPRQQSATLAIEQINQLGGLPSSTRGINRPLVMVSCDAAADLVRAATHLTDDLRVPAIVGPNTSQDTTDVSNKVTIKAGVVVVSPTALAGSIADLIDNDMTWLMLPNDVQRGKLMLQQVNQLETQLKAERGKTTIKLGIVYRDDALGVGTWYSLNDLKINGAPIGDLQNLGINVKIDKYSGDPTTDYTPVIDSQAAFGADIIVLAGTAEAITKVMTPLEAKWTAPLRPYYLGIDPFKGADLTKAVTGNDELRLRWRGTGTTTGVRSGPVFDAFNIAYQGRYGVTASASGSGPSFDASYAIAYALTATKDLPVTGASVAQGLRRLSGGATEIRTGFSQDFTAALSILASGEKIDAVGTFTPLAWDEKGAIADATIEVWCIGLLNGAPAYKSSGLTWDLAKPAPEGSYVPCN